MRACDCGAPRCERDGCQDKPTPIAPRVHRFDSAAMNDLTSRAAHGEPDIEYLVAALNHYRRSYADLLKEMDAIEARARSINLWNVIAS